MNKVSVALGAIAILAISAMLLMLLPYFSVLRTMEQGVPKMSLSSKAKKGREAYVDLGCVYCHSQQPRNENFGADFERGWGAQPEAVDYYHEFPHQLGTMRTGPDLFNFGDRNPSMQWNLIHLYNPRLMVPWSTMPAFPFLFEKRPLGSYVDQNEVILELPNIDAKLDYQVIAKQRAVDLVVYLQSLKERK